MDTLILFYQGARRGTPMHMVTLNMSPKRMGFYTFTLQLCGLSQSKAHQSIWNDSVDTQSFAEKEVEVNFPQHPDSGSCCAVL